jgi:hypothetical protein
MVDIKFNPQNIMLIVGGAVSLFWAQVGWKSGWNIIPTLGGLIGIGAGLADATGILPTVSKTTSNYAASYNTTLPYDPNNYYLPPRDSSIRA